MISADQIRSIFDDRKIQRGYQISAMQEVSEAYGNRIVLPLPEIDGMEKPAVANLLQQGIDQTSMRIASTMPDIFCPPTTPGQKTSERQARQRRFAMLSWWDDQDMRIKMRQRARHLIAYTSSPVIIRRVKDGPIWELRNPLTAYPPNATDPSDIQPSDCIFAFMRSYQWLQTYYPTAVMQLNQMGAKLTGKDRVQLLEYVDANEHVLIASASVTRYDNAMDPSYRNYGQTASTELVRTPNLVEQCPVVIPTMIGLDEPVSGYTNLIGMYQTQALVMALSIHAVKRGVFKETWIVDQPGKTAKIIAKPNAFAGEVGHIHDGAIQEINLDPAFASGQMLDRLEQAQRVEGEIPAEFGGESPTNIRTGRRGDQVLASTIDFKIQESQELLAKALEIENSLAAKTEKKFHGQTKRSFYIQQPGYKGPLEYKPSELFVSDRNHVRYAMAGADVNQLTVNGLQRVGAKTMAIRTFMSQDPMIQDPESESDQIIAEGLENALLQSIEQQATQGAIPPSDLARIVSLVTDDKKDLADAVNQVQKEAQQRQAAQAPQGAPETQPGLAQPGQGAEQPSIPSPGASLGNLKQLVSQLHNQPQKVSAQ